MCFILDSIKSTSVAGSLFIRDIRDLLIVTLNLHLKLVTRKTRTRKGAQSFVRDVLL